MDYLAAVFTGLLLCNSIPHIVAALQGQPFPSPFAKPRGVGNSSPMVNILWGGFNLIAGLGLLVGHPVPLDFDPRLGALLGGALFGGAMLASNFGKVMAARVGARTPGP
jgi:hypothetical protein